MENREDQNSDISKSQAAQQPNFDQSKQQPETSEDKQAELDKAEQAELDKSSDTLTEQKQPAETDTGESLDQRGQAEPGFVGTGEDESSDEFIDRDKQSDGE